jgi:hypothetical protein
MNSIKAINDSRKKEMSPSQHRAMMKKIKEQCAVYYRNHEVEVIASMFWYLYEREGWDYEDLRHLWEDFMPTLNELIDHYELSEDDTQWLCLEKLKTIGVDLVAWEAEERKKQDR